MSEVKGSASVETEAAVSPAQRRQHKPSEGGSPSRKIQLPQDPSAPIGEGENPLYIGIDLGTSRTSISTSNGSRHTLLTCVG